MIPTANLLLITRKIKNSGKYPVKIRVIYDRKSKDFPIGLDLTQSEFDGAISKNVKKDFRRISMKLNEGLFKANKIISDIGIFTFQKFQDQFNGRLKEASNIYPFFDEYILSLENQKRIKTAISYKTAKHSFEKYKKNLGLYDITPQFLKQYELYQNSRGISNTTVGIYVRALRAIYNYAISLNVIKRDESYPFGKSKFVIPAGRNIKKALKKDEVLAIFNYEIMPGTPMEKARDFWMLSFFCNGINFADIAKLKNKDIDENMLRFVRAKSENSTRADRTIISCHLTTPSLAIINKWRSKIKTEDDYLFPILEPSDSPENDVKKIAQFIKNTNKYMNRITTDLGFTKKVTTYFSRHSAATILKNSGAPIEQIKEALGHHSSNTTQKYLDSFDDDSKKQISNTLSNFI